MRAVSRVQVLPQQALESGIWHPAPQSPWNLLHSSKQLLSYRQGHQATCSSPPCPAQHCPGVSSVGSPAGLSKYFTLQQGFSTNDLGELSSANLEDLLQLQGREPMYPFL